MGRIVCRGFHEKDWCTLIGWSCSLNTESHSQTPDPITLCTEVWWRDLRFPVVTLASQ